MALTPATPGWPGADSASGVPAPDGRPGAGGPTPGAAQTRLAWRRLRADRSAMAAAAFVGAALVLAVSAPAACAITGNDPTSWNTSLVDVNGTGLPYGRFGGVSAQHWFGVEPKTGRDLFCRTIVGLRTSMAFGLLATVVGVGLGTILGATAGYLGGWIDRLIGRFLDLLLAFPFLLFVISVTPLIRAGLDGFGLGRSNIARLGVLICIVGAFGAPWVARVVRGITLSLREREFVLAAQVLGAGSPRILLREIAPNLGSPVLVLATVAVPINIAAEAGLSFLGVGVLPPAASLGQLQAAAIGWVYVDPAYLLIPGTLLFLTVLALNLLGDGVRDALDPSAARRVG